MKRKKRVALVYASYDSKIRMYYTNWPNLFTDEHLDVQPFSLVSTQKGYKVEDNTFYCEGKLNKLRRFLKFYLKDPSLFNSWLKGRPSNSVSHVINDWASSGGLINFQPDVIHLVNSQTYLRLMNLSLPSKPKMIASFHGFDTVFRPHIDPVWRNAIFELFERADTLHYVSQWLFEEARKLGAPEEKCKVIYAGVDSEYFKPKTTSDDLQAQRRIQIISTGRLDPDKGYEFVFIAIKDLLNEGFDLDYSIIGFGEDLSRLENIVQDLGITERVHFLGYKTHEEMLDVLNNADIFLHPSLTEALPLSILEACSLNLPIIASSVGGIPEIIKDHVNGLLIEPKQPLAIKEAINFLIQNKALSKVLADKARETVILKFSKNCEIKNWRDLYLNI